ncbi:MAG TPA: (2Fe-2S)-binding protein [Chloroflexota bacterium]|nr:(2Fe-2S)-binding protein [Chloroflexota bacterium]
MSEIELRVNGGSYTVDVDPSTPLLYVLRNDLGLSGPKFGCGLGQCGACTVIIGSQAARSCQELVSRAARFEITTLEGLGTEDDPHPIQQAFIDEQAAQCGYCINGMIMTAKAYVDRNPNADDDEIRHALDGNLCRCGTHLRILRAVARYAQEVRS